MYTRKHCKIFKNFKVFQNIKKSCKTILSNMNSVPKLNFFLSFNRLPEIEARLWNTFEIEIGQKSCQLVTYQIKNCHGVGIMAVGEGGGGGQIKCLSDDWIREIVPKRDEIVAIKKMKKFLMNGIFKFLISVQGYWMQKRRRRNYEVVDYFEEIIRNVKTRPKKKELKILLKLLVGSDTNRG